MSWLSSLMSALGSGASSALDEAGLVARGMVDETTDPLSANRFGNGTRPQRVLEGMNSLSLGDYQDPSAGKSYEDELLYNLMSAIDAPMRAIDRASKTYTGNELFADRPYLGHNNAMSGVADQHNDSNPAEELANLKASTESELSSEPSGLAERMHILNMKNLGESRALEKAAADKEIMARLASLQSASNPDTLSFAAMGDRNAHGDIPELSSPEHQMFNPDTGTIDTYHPAMGGSFSHSQRPVVEQEQIRQLGVLGVPRQAAEAVVDNTNSEQSRKVMMELTSRQLMSRQQMVEKAISDYQTAVSKAQNPQQVQGALIMQLRNIGLSDPAIKMMLMSLGIS